ncbi:Thioredoxin [Malonomonas rubra DSM 5091]|uniref:Thioredoxin n=1 Tax=Malonomonas rubra DSM 5091 TaxID=1122189 RepID=A0A1M6HBP7_MALRU|nr:thioredoxin domain-containing protein [Malonomonas rubra]SHJ19563.1 Thioredoxin [Malonomonas rubra DSM 5091]
MHKAILLFLFILFIASPLLAANEVEVRMLRTVSLAETPKQVVSTADGQRIYVLNEKGEVALYSSNGDLMGTFDAGPDVTGIAPQGSNRLVLEMADQKQLILAALEPVVHISTKDAPVLGPENAPVTIAVFDDFECPYCAKAVPLIKQVVNAYKDKVKLVYKHFPLGMHKNARAAAIASMAAQEQGKFWPYHDLLFANYNKLNSKKFTELAKDAGLDLVKFAADRKDPRLQQRLQLDQEEGRRIGVRGTPTIFVNGRRLPQRSRQAFDQMIQEELAKAQPGRS